MLSTGAKFTENIKFGIYLSIDYPNLGQPNDRSTEYITEIEIQIPT